MKPQKARSVSCGMIAACLAATGAGAAHGEYHYSYFKEKRPLQVDVGRVAFMAGLANGAAAATDLARYGIVEATVERWPIAPWRIASPTKALRSADGIRRTVERLSTDETIAFASPVFVGNDGGPVIVTPTILVGFDRALGKARADALLVQHDDGVILEREWAGMVNVYKFRSSSTNGFDVLEAANTLAQLPEVTFAEPDMMFTGRGSLTPNDPLFPDAWGLHNTGQSGGQVDFDMDAPEAWDLTTGDPSIIVLVLDTGVQQDHPDINQITPGIDTTSQFGDGGPVNACDNHGTAVAGCVSAIINNSLGVVGTCPNCRVASARPFISNVPCDGGWNSNASWTVDALVWGESIGAQVSNNSNFYGFTSSAIATKYETTRDDGMVHFSSAGNFTSTLITYPASLPTVNAVAASNRNGNRAGFSNWGFGLAFTAPGEDIITCDRTGSDGWVFGDYVFASGTSFASPYSAGVAGLILSLNPNLTAQEVEERMQQGAVDLGSSGYDTDYGWGHVNAVGSMPLAACGNDFQAATTPPTGGAGGERLPRFGCLEASSTPTIAGTAGTAVRVTLKKMYNTTPGDPDGASVCTTAGRTAPSLSQFEGDVRWLGTPVAAADDAVPPPLGYLVAPLVCSGAEAAFRDWTRQALAQDFPGTNPGGVYFFGSEVVPCSVYEVSHCTDPLDEGTCADPELIRTGRLGDCWPPFDPAPAQPSFTDIGATVAKFKSLPFVPGATPTGGPPEWHALLRGNIVAGYDVSTARKVDFIDIGRAVEGFKQIAYKEDGPCDPDTGIDNCGSPCSTAP